MHITAAGPLLISGHTSATIPCNNGLSPFFAIPSALLFA